MQNSEDENVDMLLTGSIVNRCTGGELGDRSAIMLLCVTGRIPKGRCEEKEAACSRSRQQRDGQNSCGPRTAVFGDHGDSPEAYR
ncbi:uncharacterized protein MEPE_06059 [Melanopsichium pennsylvanicum]|uniref:Uncharacterized protein n=1 Tax=Melanopsichium pennsylvanicum TaxID=63383 RepID=A0AAJ4XRT9_9BASI|nr:uncharacterized protein MEPE_06059 [Melanopsichium pennsylvanicum]